MSDDDHEWIACPLCGAAPFATVEDDGTTIADPLAVHNELFHDGRHEDEPARWASPQAWRRVRMALTESEARDIARDIADTMPVGSPDEIFGALWLVDWSTRRQA